jgi:pyruvate/2-oxoglutarate dehydrogenase complex dihydrolipoamide dehydrogenase (E3) component
MSSGKIEKLVSDIECLKQQAQVVASVTTPRKRIGILGAGAIGSVVGGMLAKAGHDVTLIDAWFEHIEAIQQKGLVIQTPQDR